MKTVSETEAWTGLANCRDCAIRKSVLFAGLDEADFAIIHQPINQYVYASGRQLYNQEDEADAIFTIRSGLVKLSQYLPDGTQRIVRLLHTTDTVGLEAIILDRYEHSAVALQPTEVCRIPVTTIQTLVSHKPLLYHELMARWHRALRDCDRMITQFNTGPARARVARLLLWLAQRDASAQCDLFDREDLAAVLALTTETVSRTMAELKRQGYISEPRANQILCDMPALQRLVS